MNRYALILAVSLMFASGKFDCRALTHEGLTYEPISDSEVAITHGDTGLTGEVILPGKIAFQGVNYTVSSIAVGAFMDCVNLKSIVIPSTINTIGNDAFNYCQSLNRVYIGDGDASSPLSMGYIPNLNAGLFADAHLESLYLGCNLDYNKRRGFSPFSGQKKLSFVKIGPYVSELPEYLFADCTSLMEIRLVDGRGSGNPPTVASTAFLNVDKKKCRVVLEMGSVEEFAAAPGWCEFENIMYAWESSVNTPEVEDALDITVSDGLVCMKNCPTNAQVTVLRFDGSKVTDTQIHDSSAEIQLEPGLYLFVVKTPDLRKVLKFAV